MFNVQSAYSGLSVDNLERARDFYAQTLGLTVTGEEMGHIVKLPNAGDLFIYEKGEGHQPATYTVLNFVVDDIDAAVDELVKRGVVFEHYDSMPAPQDEKGILRGLDANQGPNIAWFKDSAGNILSVVQEK